MPDEIGSTVADDNDNRENSGEVAAARQSDLVDSSEVVSGIIGLVHQIFYQGPSDVCKAGTIPAAFVLRPSHIENLQHIVDIRLAPLPALHDKEIVFAGTVGYADLTTDKFDSLDELRNFAGIRKSPTDLTLRWRVLLREPFMKIASIEVTFHTDARKDIDALNLLDFPLASIEYEIAGMDRDWVDATAEDVMSVLKSTRLRGIYRPLLIFRNRMVVHVFSWSLALIVEIAAISSIGRALAQHTRLDYKTRILDAAGIEGKFDEFVQYMFSNSPISHTVLSLGSALVLMFAVLVLGFWALPKLVPRSGVLIGLERTRWQQYENVFRFVIFTLGIGGIGVAIIVKILEAIF